MAQHKRSHLFTAEGETVYLVGASETTRTERPLALVRTAGGQWLLRRYAQNGHLAAVVPLYRGAGRDDLRGLLTLLQKLLAEEADAGPAV